MSAFPEDLRPYTPETERRSGTTLPRLPEMLRDPFLRTGIDIAGAVGLSALLLEVASHIPPDTGIKGLFAVWGLTALWLVHDITRNNNS